MNNIKLIANNYPTISTLSQVAGYIPNINFTVSNVAFTALGIFGGASLVSSSFRNRVRNFVRFMAGNPLNSTQKSLRAQLQNPDSSVTPILQKMATLYTPDEMLQELEYCIKHMSTTRDVEDTFKRSKPGRVFNYVRNNNLSEKQFIQLADDVRLTKNPLYTRKTDDEKSRERVSYFSAFVTKTVTYIPGSFLNLLEFIQDYPTQIIAIVFGTIAPYTIHRLSTDVKPFLEKFFGDIDTLLANHSGKVTILFTLICAGLYYAMRSLKNPSVTDYADEVVSGKVPHRGLDNDPSFVGIIKAVKLCLKKGKFQSNSSILIKSPLGTYPPIEQTLQMFAEMAITGRNGFKKHHKFKKVNLNKILTEACGDQKALKRIWERVAQDYEHDENTFLYLEDFQNVLLPLDKEAKKKTEVNRLRDLIKESIQSGRIRVILSGDKDLENFVKKNPSYFQKFKVTASPSISDIKQYINEVYNPIDQWDRIGFTSDAIDFISTIPTVLHQEDRLPSEIEKSLNSVMNEVETMRNNVLMENSVLSKKYKAIAKREGVQLESLKEMKEQYLQKWWALRQAEVPESSPELKEVARQLILINYVLIPCYAQALNDKLIKLNATNQRKKDVSESSTKSLDKGKAKAPKAIPAPKIPLEIDRQQAIKLFSRYYKNKLAPHVLDEDRLRIEQCFYEHLKTALPGRENQIMDVYRAVQNWMDKDQGPNCKPAGVFVLGGPGGWGKTLFSEFVAKILNRHLDVLNHDNEENGITTTKEGLIAIDPSFKSDTEYLFSQNHPLNYINVDLTQNPWESGNHSNQVIDKIKHDITEQPMAVFNLDEMGKIPYKKADMFLGIFDGREMTYTPLVKGTKKDDRVEDTQSQQPVDRRNCFIFITTNLCESDFTRDEKFATYESQQEKLKEEFIKHFGPKLGKAFSTRVTEFIPMPPLDADSMHTHIARYLKSINDSFNREYHMTFDYDVAVDYFAQTALEKELSLRQVQDLIEKTINPLVSKETYTSLGYSDRQHHHYKLVRKEDEKTPFECKHQSKKVVNNSFSLDEISSEN